MREISPSKKGYQDERCKLNAWRRTDLACRFLSQVQGKDLALWRDSEIQHGSARRKLALLSHVFVIAKREWGMVGLTNPADNIRMPPPGHAKERRLVNDEYPRLLSTAQVYGGEIGPLPHHMGHRDRYASWGDRGDALGTRG